VRLAEAAATKTERSWASKIRIRPDRVWRWRRRSLATARASLPAPTARRI